MLENQLNANKRLNGTQSAVHKARVEITKALNLIKKHNIDVNTGPGKAFCTTVNEGISFIFDNGYDASDLMNEWSEVRQYDEIPKRKSSRCKKRL